MTCRDLDQFLFPYLDGELQGEEQLVVERHLAGCPDCALRVHGERRFLETVRVKAAGATAAPAHLRDALSRAVGDEERRGTSWRWIQLGAAAALVAVTAGAYVSQRPSLRQRFAADAAQRHARRFPFEIQRASPDQIEAWFGGKLDHRVAVPSLPHAQPAGARLLNVQDRQAAYIAYEANPPGNPRTGRIGLFVFGDKDGDVDARPLPDVEVGSSHGYNVVSWREGDVVYQLVSDLDEHDIRQMLRTAPMSRHSLQRDSVPSVSVQPASLQQ